jgi:murein DD-endopeptidase MepM/ murein hydrolase activator NlpD
MARRRRVGGTVRAARHGAVMLVTGFVAALAVALQPAGDFASSEGAPRASAHAPAIAVAQTALSGHAPAPVMAGEPSLPSVLAPPAPPGRAGSSSLGDTLDLIAPYFAASPIMLIQPDVPADAPRLSAGPASAILPSSGERSELVGVDEAPDLAWAPGREWMAPARDQLAPAQPDASAMPPSPSGPSLRFRWPLDGEITTYFGERGPLSPRGHSGLDIANVWGSPVRAVEDGRVVAAISDDSGYGWHIIVDHGDETTSLYGHLSAFHVQEGDWVTGGQLIGAVGSTGLSTGPHLHFELRRRGRLQDPLRHLP